MMRCRPISGTFAALGALWLLSVPAACSDKKAVEVAESNEPSAANAGDDSFMLGDDALGSIDNSAEGPADLEDPTQRCLGETRQAEAIGLDIFVMLDTSGSMLDPLPNPQGTATTKWDAVRQSLQAFVQDENTADIGIGLQYFPQFREGVPPSCSSNAECGADGGPCSNSICLAEIDGVLIPLGDAIEFCLDDRDCAGGADCRTVTGQCVLPPGTPDALEGAIFGVPRPGDDIVVPPLCDARQANSCAALTDAVCDQMGLCENDPNALCSASIPCPAGLGQCLGLPDVCLGETLCSDADYATPAVAISSDAGRSFEIILSLQAQEPTGLTPTGPALTGALEHSRQWALDHPGRQVVTVMATDGFPTECAPQAIDDLARIAEDGNTGQRPVRTFVIGVFSDADLGADGQARLDTLARAGGSDRAIVIDTQGGNVADEFLNALNLIRDTAVSCEFQLAADRALNFNEVNLSVTHPDGTVTDLFNVGAQGACGSDDQGWYYVMNDAGTPIQINVCPSTCDTFMQGDIRAELQIGCETRIR